MTLEQAFKDFTLYKVYLKDKTLTSETSQTELKKYFSRIGKIQVESGPYDLPLLVFKEY